MSRYLLDTNVLIPMINGTVDRLPMRLRALMREADWQPVVSVVSAWEIAIKSAVGKLQIDADVAELGSVIHTLGCTLLPMSIDPALEVAYPEPATKDPFDRLLLAVCACEGLKLLTTDGALEGHRLVY